MSVQNAQQNARQNAQHLQRLISIGVLPIENCVRLQENVLQSIAETLNEPFESADKTCTDVTARLSNTSNSANERVSEDAAASDLPTLLAEKSAKKKAKRRGIELSEGAPHLIATPSVALEDVVTPSACSYTSRRLDALLTEVQAPTKEALLDKNAALRQRFAWPEARSLDKDVDLMCSEFFVDNRTPLQEAEYENRVKLLYGIAQVFYGEEALRAAVEDDDTASVTTSIRREAFVEPITGTAEEAEKEKEESQVEKQIEGEKAPETSEEDAEAEKNVQASLLIHRIVMSSHGAHALRGKKGQDVRRAARLCLLLSHPIIQTTLKRHGQVEHLDRQTVASLLAIEKDVEKEYIDRMLHRDETWSEWFYRNTSESLKKLFNLASRVGYPSWKRQKKVLLNALRNSKNIELVATKTANVVYGKQARSGPEYQFFARDYYSDPSHRKK